MKWWLIFVVGAAFAWGTYVPLLHQGQQELGRPSALRAFLFVGIAYFLTAVLLPGILLWGFKAEPLTFNMKGAGFSLVAGVAGAAGALCVAFAILKGGKPVIVAPLIFAGAPMINTLVSMVWHPPATTPKPIFFIGILMAAVGAGIALWSKPS
jgi:uncharacterized membrane protein